jgi:hypothetical protein
MAPGHQHPDQISGDLPLGKKHLEYLVPEHLLEILAYDDGSHLESACTQKTAIGRKNVAVRIESQKITKCLDGNHRTWHAILPRSPTFEIHLESLPGATAQLGKQVSVIKEIPAEDLGDTEDKMSMGHRLDHFLAEPLTELHHPFLVARWTEVAPLARERQEILMAAIPALDPGKAVVEIATVKVPIDDLSHIWAEKAMLPLKPVFINLLKGIKVVFYALVVG